MDKQKRLEEKLRRFERDQHQLWHRAKQLEAFLSENIAMLVNNCMAQKIRLEKQHDELSDKADALRLQLRKLVGPAWRCLCAEFACTGQCGHIERLNEQLSREDDRLTEEAEDAIHAESLKED